MRNKINQIFFPVLAIFGIISGEIFFYYGKIDYGFIIQMLSLLGIIFMVILFHIETKIKNVLQSLVLLILLRITSLAMPLFFDNLHQYQLIYGIMFIPISAIIKNQKISRKELGIDFKRFYIYLPTAFIIGTIIAIIENRILLPLRIIDDINLRSLLSITFIMVFFIGTVEELIFRSILFTRFEQIFSLNLSIVLSGIIFGIMHSNYGILNEILFSSILGIFLAYSFYKTKSLPFMVVIHGSANVFLYGILPK